MQLSETNRRALLIAVNQAVEEHAVSCADALFQGRKEEPAYPPNGGFAPEEAEALKLLEGNKALHSALRKVLANCAAGVMFDLFNLIDETAEPNQGEWSGVLLVDKSENDGGQREFLHDDFFEAYWEWRDIRPAKTWRLDLLAD